MIIRSDNKPLMCSRNLNVKTLSLQHTMKYPLIAVSTNQSMHKGQKKQHSTLWQILPQPPENNSPVTSPKSNDFFIQSVCGYLYLYISSANVLYSGEIRLIHDI